MRPTPIKAAVLAALALAAGCSDDNDRTPDATALADFSSPYDYAGCTQYGVFTPDLVQVIETNDPQTGSDWNEVIIGEHADNATLFDTLEYSYTHSSGTADPTLPRTITLGPTTLSTCVDCLYIRLNVDSTTSNATGTLFLAQGGSVVLEQADHTGASGMASVNGQSIQLLEWSTDADMPAASGNCLDISTFSMNGAYGSATTDGGADL